MADTASKRIAAPGGPSPLVAPPAVLASSCCLILMFTGAWTCDYAVLCLASPPGDYLSIRGTSLAAYLLFFLLLCLAARRRERRRAAVYGLSSAILRRGIALGCIGLVAGSIALTTAAPRDDGALLALIFLVKSVGPPLSAAVLLLFASMAPARASKAAGLAMTLAFLAECLLRLAFELTSLGGEAALIFGALCQIGGCCATSALARRHGSAPNPLDDRHAAAQPGWSRKSLVKALACIAATALMLGYLRTGASPGNSVGAIAAVTVFVAIAAGAWCLPNADTRSLFAAAIICVSGAFLLEPLIDLAAPRASSVLADCGTILFEILIWVISVSLVRTRLRMVRAAAGARLATVFGHFAGAVAAALAANAGAQLPEASQATSLALVFVYVVLLLVVARDFPLFSPADPATERAASSPGGASGEEAAARMLSAAGAPAPDGAHRDGDAASAGATPVDEERYWADPCRALADRFGLTPRETEVLEQLAQGRDLAFMEEKFVLSRNTVKMHVRNVYAKLGIHGKQEAIDLVEATRRR